MRNFWLFLFVLCPQLIESTPEEKSSISGKGRKLALGNGKDDTDDGFWDTNDLGNDDVSTTTEDPFFSDFGDDVDSFADNELVSCDQLTQMELDENVPCKNETQPVEPRFNDRIFERLAAQVWSDFQFKLNTEEELYGLRIDPLDIDSFLPEAIDLHQSGTGYQADIKMHGIQLFGLSGIYLKDSIVTRNENLTDMELEVQFAFDQLVANGTYSISGWFGWWQIDSKGEQDFEIKIVNATLSYKMRMEFVDGSQSWASLECGPDGNVLITDIGLPLKYDDIDFRFDNLGAFYNTVVNGIGIYILQIQEEALVGTIRKAIKQNANSLIC